MSSYEGLASPKLSIRRHNAQVAELMVSLKIMNKVIDPVCLFVRKLDLRGKT